MTVRLLPEYRTRTPFELGWSPSPERITPDFSPSSKNAPIAARSFSSGRTPASVSLSALSRPMNRIVPGFRAGGGGRAELLFLVAPSVGRLGRVHREVRQFEERTNLDLAFPEGDALRPFDGFFLRFRL